MCSSYDGQGLSTMVAPYSLLENNDILGTCNGAGRLHAFLVSSIVALDSVLCNEQEKEKYTGVMNKR